MRLTYLYNVQLLTVRCSAANNILKLNHVHVVHLACTKPNPKPKV